MTFHDYLFRLLVRRLSGGPDHPALAGTKGSRQVVLWNRWRAVPGQGGGAVEPFGNAFTIVLPPTRPGQVVLWSRCQETR